jgi:hypothetical protein
VNKLIQISTETGALGKDFLTAKNAKKRRKDHKELNINNLSLRPLRNPKRSLRLMDFAFFSTQNSILT